MLGCELVVEAVDVSWWETESLRARKPVDDLMTLPLRKKLKKKKNNIECNGLTQVWYCLGTPLGE